MTVRDKIKRTSRLFMKPVSDKDVSESQTAQDAGSITKSDPPKKSADFEDAKASTTDKPVSVADSLEASAEKKDVEDKVQKEAEKVAAAASVEKDDEVLAVQEKATEKDDGLVERRKSFFKRKPTVKNKEGSSDEGFSKELKKLQRVLSKVKRQPKKAANKAAEVKEEAKEEVKEAEAKAAAAKAASEDATAVEAAKGETVAVTSADEASPVVVGKKPTDVKETAEVVVAAQK